MFKNKYSSFNVGLAKPFLFWMELLVIKWYQVVFTDKILRRKVTFRYLQYSSMGKSMSCMGDGQI